MLRLGFNKVKYKKGMFFDGHDRDDQLRDRKKYLAEKEERDKRTVRTMPTQDEIDAWLLLPVKDRPFVELIQDESACNANDRGNGGAWVQDGKIILRSKSPGQGVMVSAFINEITGKIVEFNGERALAFLEYGKGNWWTAIRKDDCAHKKDDRARTATVSLGPAGASV